MQTTTQDAIKEKFKSLKTPAEQTAFMKELLGSSFDILLEAEVAERIGEKPNATEKIQSLKSKGMTTGGIRSYMKEIEGVNVSREKISLAMEEGLPKMQEWLTRPLAKVYPIVFLDAMRCHIRENGKTVLRCSYHAIGINMDGEKELLGIWIADTEGAKLWQRVLTEMKNRGTDDVLIFCIDGLKGFSKAIETVFPKAVVQQCINHLVRNSSKFVTGKNKEKFCADLKDVYNAPTEEAGRQALEEMKAKWPDFVPFLKRWEKEWVEVAPFFSYTQPVRRLIYTTNPIESLHSIFRRALNARGVLPNEEAVIFTLWSEQLTIMRKWTGKPLKDWGTIIAQLSITFPDRNLLD